MFMVTIRLGNVVKERIVGRVLCDSKLLKYYVLWDAVNVSIITKKAQDDSLRHAKAHTKARRLMKNLVLHWQCHTANVSTACERHLFRETPV